MKNYLSLLFTVALRKDDTRIEASVSVGQMEQHYQDILDYFIRTAFPKEEEMNQIMGHILLNEDGPICSF